VTVIEFRRNLGTTENNILSRWAVVKAPWSSECDLDAWSRDRIGRKLQTLRRIAVDVVWLSYSQSWSRYSLLFILFILCVHLAWVQ